MLVIKDRESDELADCSAGPSGLNHRMLTAEMETFRARQCSSDNYLARRVLAARISDSLLLNSK